MPVLWRRITVASSLTQTPDKYRYAWEAITGA